MTPARHLSCDVRRARDARPRRGFTLIEVMVALAIMSAIMVSIYTVLNGMLETRDELEHEAKAARLGPEILDLIEADLRRCWVMNVRDDKVFKAESRILGGDHADWMMFLTTVDSITTHRIEDADVPSDLCETGYQLRTNPELSDVLELWRRQSLHVDEDPLEGGIYERIADRVVSFRLRYYDRVDRFAEAVERWDASEQHRLPALVDVQLELEVVPRTIDLPPNVPRSLTYRRMIPLMRDSDLALRVHPIPPAFEYSPPGASQGPGALTDEDGNGEPDEQSDETGNDTNFEDLTDDTGTDDTPDLGSVLDEIFGGAGGG